MTALENVAVASPAQRGENPLIAFLRPGKSKEELHNIKQASKWLSGLGLGERLDSSCDKISLGQMKRVAIARAVHAGAKILFLLSSFLFFSFSSFSISLFFRYAFK